MSEDRTIHVGEDHDQQPVDLPVVELLTGRGFVTGKSGSGKSNTASVIAEELLEEGYPLVIVDTDGEYYGLKEAYELLHAGADEECDIQVSPEHAEKIASLALEGNVPIILDVSGYLDDNEAEDLIRETARHLFVMEKKLKKPFLLIVEEIHEYVPEGAGLDETGKMLIKVGKRGRKHGLGIVGISQRPADVKKDFITQANWLVWHRLTWENDTDVVGRIVGTEYAEAAPELDDGQAFLQRDWTDDDVTLVQFDRKRTFDAGATPGLDEIERPELKSVNDALMDDLQGITDARERERDRIEEVEATLETKNEEIAQLEEELRSARNVSQAATRMADALSDHVPRTDEPYGYEERLRQKNERIDELRQELADQQATIEALRSRLEDGGEREDPTGSAEDPSDLEPSPSGTNESHGTRSSSPNDDVPETGEPGQNGLLDGLPNGEGPTVASLGETASTPDSPDRRLEEGAPSTTSEHESVAGATEDDSRIPESQIEHYSVLDTEEDVDVDDHLARLREKGEQLLAADEDNARWQRAPDPAAVVSLLTEEAVVNRIDGAIRESRLNGDLGWSAVAAIAARGTISLGHLADHVDAPTEHVESLLSELRSRSLVIRDSARRYAMNVEEMRRGIDADERPIDDPGRQWAVDG